MTVPMTPSEPYPQYPTPQGHGPDTSVHQASGNPGGPGFSEEAPVGALVAIAVTVSGVLLGLAWLWLAPRVPLISDGRAVYLKDGEGEQAIGIDGWFTLLGAGFGVVSAVVVYFCTRRGGVAVVLGLAVGGVLASVVAWRLGVLLGPPQDVAAHAREVGRNKVFDQPLKLQAKGALMAWPLLAMATHLILTAALTPRDEAPPRTKQL